MVCRDSCLPVNAGYFLPVVESGMHEALKSVFDTLLLNLIQQGGTIRLKGLITFSSDLGQLWTKGLPNSLSSSSVLSLCPMGLSPDSLSAPLPLQSR